ncbi:hypothetical protein GLOTRDRAFT_94934 [Gloeophyllum trabeum ATCC 11539]|uniref:Uncharacterized protein n=1 Tax=Gloeophyllum trabeum (strain ATCC 11539 / FP-39264 / Madison 617) TaxID=670483 RepID=S7Q2M3_GLOTA|nr:uncharacterized protein GLOTRDRAFT_94934 [Gloeophyllum trabeum ATCC 11539]EPQ53778.1 hypothetical protein GLOTRDRAFT_94934 [Gloeophyllum trabeum ATCC 11539]
MSSPTSGGYSEFYHHWCKFQECIGEPPFKPAVLFKLKASPVDEHRALAAVSTGHSRNIRRNPEKFHPRRPCTVLPDASGESELVLVPSLPSDVDVEHHNPECDIFLASRRYYRLWYCLPAGADGKRHPGLEFSLKIFEEKAEWFSISEILNRTVDYCHDLLPQDVSPLDETDTIVWGGKDSFMAIVVKFLEAMTSREITAEGERLQGEMPSILKGAGTMLSVPRYTGDCDGIRKD